VGSAMIIFLIWYLIGYASFYFWWTREFKSFGTIDVFFGFIYGFLGPLAWIIGYFIHAKSTKTSFFGIKK
jgi:hypothetical protein